MGQKKSFYNRYWNDQHIKINPFDHCPPEWTEENFSYHLNFFKPFIQGRLLDFGCGEGHFLHKTSKYCESCHGVDISNVAIARANQNYPNIIFKVLGEEEAVPYSDNYFDTVCALDVLKHILDVEGLLEEFNRVLKLGGYLLIATSELTRIKAILIALSSLDSYFYPASPHIRYFTRRNLASILERKGFRAIDYKKNRTYLGFIPQGQMVVAIKDRQVNKK